MKLGSCLSGIGGTDLGFAIAGWSIAWQIEANAYRRAVLAKVWPDVPRHEDILTVDPASLTPVDCMTFAAPTHNYREGHPLLEAFCELAHALKPRYVLLETPIGVGSRDDGADWTPLEAHVSAVGYECLHMQSILQSGLVRWTRQFLLGVLGPVPPHVLAWNDKLVKLTHDVVPMPWEDESLGYTCCYGLAELCLFEDAEEEYGFPRGWTAVPGVSAYERRQGLRDCTAPAVGEWWGRMLGRETA